MEKVSEVSNKVLQSVKLADAGKQTWIIILVVIAMLTIVLVVLFIVSMVKKNKLQNVVLQQNLIKTDDRTIVPFIVPAASMSLISNGQEFSYSFWIFLSSNYTATAGGKVLLQRGLTPNTYSASTIQINSGTNPLIFLDATSNKMYFCIQTNLVNSTTQTLENIITIDSSTNKYTSGYLVSYIDYVPLQRWVNIALVVKNTAAYIYMDADLYSVASLNEIATSSSSNPIMSGTSGDMTIGDIKNNTPGYISLSRFYNFALGQTDLKTMYNNGPSQSTWLSYIGLGNYGVRSPIYETS